MPPESTDIACLWDMLVAAREVLEFVGDKPFEVYVGDRMLQAAIEQKIEIIGEAASKVSGDFQNAHPEIPWRRIIGQRHILVHEYGDIEPGIIWRLLKTRIPELIEELEPMVPPPPDISP